MKTTSRLRFLLLAAGLMSLSLGSTAFASPFNTSSGSYSQQIFAAPLTPNQEAGMAWTSGGNLLTRANVFTGAKIIEHSLTQSLGPNATMVHAVTTVHSIAGLSPTGYGMTTGFDGKIYTATAVGLQRFDPNNWAAPAVTLAGTVGGPGWGITTMSNGKIAYSDSANIFVYDPGAATNSLIYTSGPQVDDIEASSGGFIAITGHSNNTITILTNSGTVVNTFSTNSVVPTVHNRAPDGLAFGDGANNPNTLFSNNNDGSVTEYRFSPGYLGLPTITDILQNLPQGNVNTGGAYGDLASVGPDCAFYVTQYENGGSNGSTPGVGTHWDNGTTTADASIIRIALLDSTGVEICGFDSTTHMTPEPSTFVLGGMAMIGLVVARRRMRR